MHIPVTGDSWRGSLSTVQACVHTHTHAHAQTRSTRKNTVSKQKAAFLGPSVLLSVSLASTSPQEIESPLSPRPKAVAMSCVLCPEALRPRLLAG